MENNFTVTKYCAITTEMPHIKTVYLVKTKRKLLYLKTKFVPRTKLIHEMADNNEKKEDMTFPILYCNITIVMINTV
jgi:hypothetical protein